ncbi:MAG: XRE family transcriptional regulator [Clostridia bacterium]|nr:XRE family transcriptional regulator [Clostridia bacterium]
MLLGEIIKQYRSEHNLSMQNFADLIYSSKSYVSMLEKNINPATGKPIKPSIETLKSIASAMHLQIEDLLSLLDDKQEIILNEDTNYKQIDIQFEKSQERLKDCREKKNYTIEDLAQILKIDKNKLYRWENISPANMPTTAIKKLADLYEVNPTWLCGYDVPKKIITSNKKLETIKIPVVGTVAAGTPILAEQNIIDYEELPANEFKDGEYFGLKVKGNSMFPRILERDVVIVRKQEDCESGQIAVVLVNGDEATVKQVKKTASGIMLIPFNATEYEPVFFTKEDIEKKPVKIVGIVKRLIGYNFD